MNTRNRVSYAWIPSNGILDVFAFVPLSGADHPQELSMGGSFLYIFADLVFA